MNQRHDVDVLSVKGTHMLVHGQGDSHENNGTLNNKPLVGMTRRMRRAVCWTAGGILILAVLMLLVTGGIAMPGGVNVPAWVWIASLATGVALVGFGLGTIVDEASRLNRDEVEADRASRDPDEADAD